MAIALAMAEALIESKAKVWFATHFVDIGKDLKPNPLIIVLTTGKPRY